MNRLFSRSAAPTSFILALTVIFVMAIGFYAVTHSHAASLYVSLEAENGTVASPASTVNDVAASGSRAIAFGAAVQPPGGFVHPGILVSRVDLDFVKAKIAAGQEPWTTAFNKAKVSRFNSPSIASPFASVDCGPSNVPNVGCDIEVDAADQAYTEALLYYYSGQAEYAQTAIAIMNAWAGTIRSHTSSNAPLQAAWAAEVFPRAAEIIRYSYSGWSAADIQRFSDVLNNIYLSDITSPTALNAYQYSNGNWELSADEAKLNIAIFTNNRALFDQAIAAWRTRVPAYVYLTSDGPIPVHPPGGKYDSDNKTACFWLNQPATCTPPAADFKNGQIQETCRDYNHVGLGLAALFNSAETAHIQGVDLYGEQKTRLVAGLEYNTNIINTVSGANYPANYCSGSAPLKAVYTAPTYEIAYNHYASRLGVSLPSTKMTIDRLRAGGGSAVSLHMAWETLTNAGTP